MAKSRKMLNDWNAPYLQSLIHLIETQSKSTLARWAIDYSAKVLLPIWQKQFPTDARPESALSAAREWLKGSMKLPQVKPVILQCHAAAREIDGFPAAQAAARAIGQSASTIHSARHCIGLPLYGALAVAYDQLGPTAPWQALEGKAADECGRMEEALRAIAVSDEPHPAHIDWHC
jgi:hypothetical protein